MKFINKKSVQKILLGPEEQPFSMSKQLARLITFCCVLIVCIQTIVMVAMMVHQYGNQEKEDALYMLETDNKNMDTAFRYVEDLVLSIQHHTGLRPFFVGESYDSDIVGEELKTAVNLFSKKNYSGAKSVFVERVYLFNFAGDSVSQLYYPVTMREMKEEQNTYEKIYKGFVESGTDFYYRVEDETVNVCLWFYDGEMKLLGAGIFALNRSFIEENYENLDKFEHYQWYISQDGKPILGKEEGIGSGNRTTLENSFNIGFGLSLYAGIPNWVIYESLIMIVFVILLISCALILLLSFWGHHLVEGVYETQLIAQQAQIQYLQTQMNPHFLSNVLSMIGTKAAINGDTQVQQMIRQLAKLYQGKIFRKNEYFISLKEELEIAEFYLSLQKGRFGEKIAYSILFEGAEELYEKLLVPRLSIEPIVENAVCHGLQPKAENGQVTLRLLKEKEVLKVYVVDDGVGFDPDSVVQKAEDRNHTHVGLWNTNKMIRNLCGEDYGIQIESEIGKGTIVSVVLPVKYGEENVESNGCG